jgi:hypothetical protein
MFPYTVNLLVVCYLVPSMFVGKFSSQQQPADFGSTTMSPINILKFPVSSPADTSPLIELRKAGCEPSQIMAVVGKSEGNGCVNDFSRTLSTVVW